MWDLSPTQGPKFLLTHKNIVVSFSKNRNTDLEKKKINAPFWLFNNLILKHVAYDLLTNMLYIFCRMKKEKKRKEKGRFSV